MIGLEVQRLLAALHKAGQRDAQLVWVAEPDDESTVDSLLIIGPAFGLDATSLP